MKTPQRNVQTKERRTDGIDIYAIEGTPPPPPTKLLLWLLMQLPSLLFLLSLLPLLALVLPHLTPSLSLSPPIFRGPNTRPTLRSPFAKQDTVDRWCTLVFVNMFFLETSTRTDVRTDGRKDGHMDVQTRSWRCKNASKKIMAKNS